ncbi:membrane protein insertase YidC [Agaribacterium haliotis]|uniref:membrane protein insertase YidC n=1 Tax=Agaribacterium haliotis TaxID=2013869 RepID=UPI000BB57CFF|nr:membrane protein insertase YidC [Agaribacterium haliotis]
MNRLRYALMAAIAVVSYLLFMQWNDFSEKHKPQQDVETVSSAPALASPPTVPAAEVDQSNDLPVVQTAEQKVTQQDATQAQLIHISTPELEVKIDTLGGDIVYVGLPQFKVSLDSDENFVLLNRGANDIYVAQSGLVGPNGTDRSAYDRPIYKSEKSEFKMAEGQDTLNVDLSFVKDGVELTKRFSFNRGSYLIELDYLVKNNTEQLWRAAPYGQIRRTDYDVPADVGIGVSPFLGPAITTADKNYAKFSFSDIADEPEKESIDGGWLAMVQHYFISAWVPNQETENTYSLRKQSNSKLFIFEYVGSLVSIEPGQSGEIKSEFYAGPKNLRTLEAISPHLDLTIDYGFLWFIAKPLFFALDWIYGFVGNWGVAIILLTLGIKVVFFYPSAISYRSMAKMRKLQPMMAELKERYGDDRQKMSAELMKIYRKEKVNPLGGCLPILLQMPVFISLYWMLMESVELRHAPFALWITDLSVKDPFFILPLIMGFTMWIQQKLNPTPPDPMQAKIMQWLPVIFTGLFLMFPAGLVLYWVVNNTLSIAQQYVITRQIERGDSK